MIPGLKENKRNKNLFFRILMKMQAYIGLYIILKYVNVTDNLNTDKDFLTIRNEIYRLQIISII